MQFFYIFIFLILSLYSFFVLVLIFGWYLIPKNQIKADFHTKVSVIIPVRNEEKNIIRLLQSIENQTYSKNLFEVIFVNDNSTDSTLELLIKNAQLLKIDLKVIELGEINTGNSRKKAAISKAIAIANGDVILCTDGDCIVPEKWIELYVNYYKSTGCKFISGPVTFFDRSFFDQLQIVEFSSLIGTGAASIRLGIPNMCNGANLAYEKAAFFAVNGFEGFESLASGDDEFLMHKIAEKFPNKIGFLKNKDAIVTTYSQATFSDFINQRKRWASKWNKYLNIRNSILALFIFTVNFSTAIVFIQMVFGDLSMPIVQILMIKLGVEIFFIGSILTFLGYPAKVFLIPLVQLIYPFYVVFTSLFSLQKGYIWKGITYK